MTWGTESFTTGVSLVYPKICPYRFSLLLSVPFELTCMRCDSHTVAADTHSPIVQERVEVPRLEEQVKVTQLVINRAWAEIHISTPVTPAWLLKFRSVISLGILFLLSPNTICIITFSIFFSKYILNDILFWLAPSAAVMAMKPTILPYF